jgi:hypothetical protein
METDRASDNRRPAKVRRASEAILGKYRELFGQTWVAALRKFGNLLVSRSAKDDELVSCSPLRIGSGPGRPEVESRRHVCARQPLRDSTKPAVRHAPLAQLDRASVYGTEG